MTYEQADLEPVCEFLLASGAEDETKLAEKLTRRGLKQFPNSPVFLALGASLEIRKGPYRGDLRRAKKMFERALELAQEPNSRHATLVPIIKEQLSLLGDLQEVMPPFGFFGGRPSFDDRKRSVPNTVEKVLASIMERFEATDNGYEDEFENETDEPSEPHQRKRRGKRSSS
jgi:hypothetical protein